MIQQKKEIKRIVIVVLFITFILITNVQFINHSNLKKEDGAENKGLETFPNTSDLNLDDYILGSGDDQDVRIYVNNESSNLNDNEEFFKIPSIPTDDMFLTHGDFNFTFQNNYTTDYILEDDNALDAADFISFDFNENQPYSDVIWEPDQWINGGFDELVDNDDESDLWLRANATTGMLNFTVKANFTEEIYFISGKGNVEFNRDNILALILSLLFDLTLDANLTVRIKDYSQPTWINLTDPIPINSSIGKQGIIMKIINENLNYIDLSDVCYLQFIFERQDLTIFDGHFYNLELESTYAFDLPITNNTYVALEFDLKGEKTTVNGFYAWIRTLNLTEAATTELNITLYRADDTLVRTEGNLRSIQLNPNYNEMIDSKLLVNYTKDNISYFEFNTANTQNLNLSNYFVVIKSNNSNEVYSLVTLPWYDYTADGITEHQLLTTNNDGLSWLLAQKLIDTSILTYTSGQLDASPFRLNVTRGYMPSDFIYNDTNTLRIQDMTIENLEISSYPYNESSYLTWGLGRWTNTFTTLIEDTPANEFEVYLEWNKSVIEGFKFNVNYSIKAYWIEGATAYFNATYNENPEWALEYNFDKNSSKFNNWDFYEFWYVYPNYMNAHNLTNPNDEEFLWLLEQESIVSENPTKFKLVINETYSSLNGSYTLNLTSYNFVHQMHSYINYKGILSETNGFMFGDNISVSLDIQDQNFYAPIGGNTNVTLFYPNGTKSPGADLLDSTGFIDGSVLSYDFNNNTILELTNAVTDFGEYQLGFFWLNGSAIGCKKITVYIDSYDLDLHNLTYSSNLGTNVLIGELNNKVYQNYTMLIASINDTTAIPTPNIYAINTSNINQEFSFNFGGEDLSILLDSFLQSEDILNPNETINFKTSIQNTHSFIPFDVKIDTKLVSYINKDWIIAENTSNTINLNFSGHPDDSYEFNVNLTIPNLDIVTKTWEGINAPIRLGGARTIITLYIDDIIVGTYESPKYSLLSNQTSDNYDGNILGLTISEEITSRSILYEFERDECLYFPDNSSFLVNLIDRNYVSSYRQFNNEFSITLNSKFTNITIDPINPIQGQVINFSSTLVTEFGEELSNKNVTCEYFNSGSWVEIGSDMTDANGYVTFVINTLIIDVEDDLLLKVFWDGDIINGISKNISINIIHETNDIAISVHQNDVLLYRNRLNTLTFDISNTGDSNLKLFDITVDIENNLHYTIVEINYVELSWFQSGDHTEINIEIAITGISQLKVNFTITAQNVITGENITFSKDSSFDVFDAPIGDYFIEFFMFIMIGIFVIVWVLALIYVRKVRRRIEEPVEVPLRRPRKGRYIMVSDLKKPTPDKKVPKKKTEQKGIEPKKTTDLDALLEERGLAEKEKKKKSKK